MVFYDYSTSDHSHTSGAQQLQVACGYPIGQHNFKLCVCVTIWVYPILILMIANLKEHSLCVRYYAKCPTGINPNKSPNNLIRKELLLYPFY